MIKNLKANAICEARPSDPRNEDAHLWNRPGQYKVLKALPGSAIFEHNMLFDIPFKADWKQIGEYRLHQIDCSNKRENSSRVDYDYKVGDKILIHKDGILRKQSPSGEKSLDHNDSSYKWNYQDSMWNQIGKNN